MLERCVKKWVLLWMVMGGVQTFAQVGAPNASAKKSEAEMADVLLDASVQADQRAQRQRQEEAKRALKLKTAPHPPKCVMMDLERKKREQPEAVDKKWRTKGCFRDFQTALNMAVKVVGASGGIKVLKEYKWELYSDFLGVRVGRLRCQYMDKDKNVHEGWVSYELEAKEDKIGDEKVLYYNGARAVVKDIEEIP